MVEEEDEIRGFQGRQALSRTVEILVLFIKCRVFCMFSLLQGESELKSCRANEALIRYFLLVKEMEEIM